MWDYDLAKVDCWQFYSTCHCLQRSRQFELGVSEVCTRAGATGGRASCSAEGVPTWDAGGGGTGGANDSGVNCGTNCCMHQGAAAVEPAQPMTITVCTCAGRRGGGSRGGTGLSGERHGRELAEWHSQGSELAEWRNQARELAESAAGRKTVKS